MDFSADNLETAMNILAKGGSTTEALAKGVAAISGMFQRSEKAGDREMRAALAELAENVANAQLANAQLKAELAEIQIRLMRADAFAEQSKRYELWETPAGYFVRRLKQEQAGDDPAHLACPVCFSDSIIFQLQCSSDIKTCPVCKTAFRIQPSKPIRRNMRRG